MLESVYDRVIEGDTTGIVEAVQGALDEGYNAVDILDQALIAAMDEIGRRYEYSECFVPEMLMAARSMQQGLVVLKPHLVAARVEPVGRVVLGTVRGDLHDLGKKLVGIMLESAGFEVVDLGVDVPPEAFAQAARLHKPDFVGLSVLLTTTLVNVRPTLEALEEAGVRSQVKIMIGGAPVTQAFCDEVGADLYAPDAASASSRARTLLKAT